MKETAVALLLALVVATAAQTPSTCTNTDQCKLDCAGCANEELVHDPEDCHNYYMCLDGQPIPDLPLTCNEGQHFNHTTHQCVPGDECEITCTGPGAPSDCHYGCKTGAIVHESHGYQYDCSKFTLCDEFGNETQTLTCPPGAPYYDGTTCQEDESKCCSCYPYCPVPDGSMVMDPLDCTKFYLCVNDGIPDNSGFCPDGQYFDPTLHTCSGTAECISHPACLNTVRPDGCIYLYTCQKFGVEAKCPTSCSDEYYYCTTDDIGNTVEPSHCPDGEIFHPENHQCVPVAECPFPSSLKSLKSSMLFK